MRLQHEPFVAASFAENDGHPQLEWHVKARNASAQSNAAEIVKRIPALGQQLEDAPEATLRSGDFNRSTRPQSETAQAGDTSEVKRNVTAVIRDVEEGARRDQRTT